MQYFGGERQETQTDPKRNVAGSGELLAAVELLLGALGHWLPLGFHGSMIELCQAGQRKEWWRPGERQSVTGV